MPHGLPPNYELPCEKIIIILFHFLSFWPHEEQNAPVPARSPQPGQKGVVVSTVFDPQEEQKFPEAGILQAVHILLPVLCWAGVATGAGL